MVRCSSSGWICKQGAWIFNTCLNPARLSMWAADVVEQWMVLPYPEEKRPPKGLILLMGVLSTKQIQGALCIRFLQTEWVCQCLHGTCWRLCAQAEGLVKKGFQCFSAWSLAGGLLAGMNASIPVAILECYLQGKKVLLVMHGFWIQCDTIYYTA